MAILPPNRSGTGFTNLQRILQANRANRLGSTVSGGIQKAGEQTRGAIQQAGQQLKTEAQKERERQQAAEQRTMNVLGNIPGATDDDVSAFEDVRAGLSKGPKGVQNAAELQQKAREAEQLGSAVGSQAGRYGLLQRFVGGGKKYTAGQQRVDALLLGETAADQLRQARKAPLGLQQRAETEIVSGSELGRQLGAEAKGLAGRTVERLGQKVTEYDQAMADQLAAQQAERDAIIKTITDTTAAGSVDLDENVLKQLSQASGDYLKEGSELYNVDLGKYIKQNLLDASRQSAQSEADFKKAQLIKRLSGADLTGETSQTLQGYLADPTRVGAFKASNIFDVSEGDLAEAVNKARNEYQGREAARKQQQWHATRSTAVAQPGVYHVTGGHSSEVLGQLGIPQLEQAGKDFIAKKYPSGDGPTSWESGTYQSALNKIQAARERGTGISQANLNENERRLYDEAMGQYSDQAKLFERYQQAVKSHDTLPGESRGDYGLGEEFAQQMYGADLWGALKQMIDQRGGQALTRLNEMRELEKQKEALKKEYNVLRKIKKKAPTA